MPRGVPTKAKTCAICGELFTPKSPSTRFCDKEHHTRCPICGKDMVWNSTREVPPCSKACSKEKTRLMYREKYGVDHPMQCKSVQENFKKAMVEKYGVEHALQSEDIKEKTKQTNRERFGADWALSSEEVVKKSQETMKERYGAATTLQSEVLRQKVNATVKEKYGVDNIMQSEVVQQHVKDTMVERYGVDNPMKNAEIAHRSADSRSEKRDEIFEKSKQTWLRTLGADNPSKSPEVIDKITDTFLGRYGVKRAIQVPEFRQKMVDTMTERHGAPYWHLTEEYKQHSDHLRISKVGREFCKRLEDVGVHTEYEYRIGMKSFDLVIPEAKTVIEIDPTYTHNLIGNHWNKHGLPEDYHINKSLTAKQAGYRCIHIFDWDDTDKIIQMLLPKKCIFARKCTIYKLRTEVAEQFLRDFHLQGTCRGQVLCLGLVLDGVLYQVMTFGKSRYDKSHYVELLRLCTRPGYIVVGGASRLFSYATSEFGLHNIVSYCDLSKFNGDVYEKIGMKKLRVTPPQEVWSREDQKITANLLRQRGFDQLFGTHYGKGTSNDYLMLLHGWAPVIDCGQAVYDYI